MPKTGRGRARDHAARAFGLVIHSFIHVTDVLEIISLLYNAELRRNVDTQRLQALPVTQAVTEGSPICCPHLL